MLRVGVGLSAERDSERAASEAAEMALQSAGLTKADAVLVFATTPHGPGFTRVTRTVGATCSTRAVVGCSAAGVLAGDEEVEDGPGIALLALAGDVSARHFFVPDVRGRSETVADEIAAIVDREPRPPAGGTRLLAIFTDSYNVEPGPLLGRLTSRLPGLHVVGGGASEDGSVGELSVFAGDASSSNAVSGLLLSGDFRASVDVAHAVRRVGAVRRVTRAAGRVIFELDGRPAYEAFSAVVPGSLLADPRRALAVVLAAIGTEDDFVVRHLTGIDPSGGAVAVAGDVHDGEQLFFGVRDPNAAREQLQQSLQHLAVAWEPVSPAGALYVNCIGRGRRFYGVPGLDTAYIRQHLGALPVAGFFSGAEIAPGGSGTQLHQYTGVLTVLGPRA